MTPHVKTFEKLFSDFFAAQILGSVTPFWP